MIKVEHLAKSFGTLQVLKDISLSINKGEVVTIIGPSGSGKSTLLKTVLGEIAPLKGKAQTGNRVKVGYFSQSYERLDEKQTVLDNFLTEYGMDDGYARSLLGGMLFHGDDVFKEIGTLSGGQKARLVLLKLVLDGANFLILDEPTNHLDILARETLEAALEAFDGTLLVVSHDRYFIGEIAGRIWEIENHTLQDYKGDYEYYLAEKEKRKAAEPVPAEPVKKAAVQTGKEEQKPAPAQGKKAKAQRRYSPEELAKQLQKVELSIREQEAMLGVLEKQMADPANHVDLEHSKHIAAEHETMQAEIDRLMQRWEELMQAQEELENAGQN